MNSNEKNVLVVWLIVWQPEAEFEWLVGPIPVQDGVGKEVVIVYDRPDIKSNGEFWTDANGRQVGALSES